ncbi:hypothetical protein ACVWXE_000102 [Thermostichus sp. MS-CIW-41]
MIRRNTIASLYDNFIWPALDDVRDGYQLSLILREQYLSMLPSGQLQMQPLRRLQVVSLVGFKLPT